MEKSFSGRRRRIGRRTRGSLALVAAVSVALSACGSGGSAPAAAPTAPPAGGAGQNVPEVEAPPQIEVDEIVFSSRLPDMNSNAAVEMAISRGFYSEEGFRSIEVINAENVTAALVSGSIQFGVMGPGDVIQANNEGIELVIVGTWRCSESHFIAVQPDITSPAQLAGRQVLLGGVPGDPDLEERLNILRDYGNWDLRAVPNIDYVTVPGGSNAWTELFWDNRLAMTPFFVRHRPRMNEYGARIVVDTSIPRMNDAIVSTRAFIESNPVAAEAFLRATLRGMGYYLDLANKETVLSEMAAKGYATEAETPLYDLISGNFCANLHIQEPYENFLAQDRSLTGKISLADVAIIEPLVAAQESLGLPTGPVEDARTIRSRG